MSEKVTAPVSPEAAGRQDRLSAPLRPEVYGEWRHDRYDMEGRYDDLRFGVIVSAKRGSNSSEWNRPLIQVSLMLPSCGQMVVPFLTPASARILAAALTLAADHAESKAEEVAA